MEEIFDGIGEVLGDIAEVAGDAIDGLNPFHE